MTQLYVGFRDAYLAARLGTDKAGIPPYIDVPAKSGEDLLRDFAHLVKSRSDH